MQQNSTSSSNELLIQHELEVAEAVADQKAKYRKVVQAAITQWVKDFQQGNIKISTVDDLQKLIEMDIDLLKDEF